MEKLQNPIENRLNPRMFEAEPMQRCELGECKGACCVFGVWVDTREVEDILANARLIQPHMPDGRTHTGDWFVPVEDDDANSPSGKVIHTAVEPAAWHYGGTTCTFCHTVGKCALQLAAVANGLHPWRFKPFYCILHPIDLDDKGRFTLDTFEALTTEEGSCLRPADRPIPFIETFAPELKYFLGDKGYQAMLEIAALKQKSGSAEKADDNGIAAA